MAFVNTRTTYGDQGTFDRLLAHELTEYNDDGFNELGNYALRHQTGLVSVNFPNVTIIRDQAFANCPKLKTVRIGGKCTTMGSSLFTSCPQLEAIIMENESGVSSFGSSTLSGSNVVMDKAAIYVPSSRLEDYRSYGNLAPVKHLIYPIDEYPKSEFGVADSWTTIIANAQNGTHATVYAKGAIKKLEFGDFSIYMQYIGDRDEGPVWACKSVLTTNRYHSSMTPYDGSEIDTLVNTTYFGQFDSALQNGIAEVPITYYDGVAGETKTINRKVWLLSSKEVGFTGTNCKEDSGYVYSDVFTSSNSSRVKYNSNGSADFWWLRSSGSASYPASVNGSGNFNNGNANGSNGVVFGFCLKSN